MSTFDGSKQSPPGHEIDVEKGAVVDDYAHTKEVSYSQGSEKVDPTLSYTIHPASSLPAQPLSHDEVAFALRSDFKSLPLGSKVVELSRYSWRFLYDREPLIYLMGLAFICLFMGFGATSSLLTIRVGDLGSWILGVLYAVYCVTAIFSPLLVARIGAENGLLLASLGYVFFIASFFYNHSWINYLAACVGGFSAGILWACNGAILTTLSTPATRSSNTGIFQFMYRSANFTTGLAVGSIQVALPTQNQQLYLWVGLAGGGSAFFILFWTLYKIKVRQLRKEAAALVAEAEARGQQTTLSAAHAQAIDLKFTASATGWLNRLQQVFSLMVSKEFRYFCGWLIFMQGMSQAWNQSGYNRVISAGAGTAWYGWILAMDGAFAMAASFATGAWFEYLRRVNPRGFKQPVYFGFVLLYIGIGLSIYTIEFQHNHVTLVKKLPYDPNWTYFVTLAAITSLFWNIGFAIVETTIFVYIVTFFQARAEIAFAAKIALETFGWVLGFLTVPGLHGATTTDYSHYIWLPVILLTINAGSFAYFLLWKVPDLPDIYKIHANTATVVLNLTHEEDLNSQNAASQSSNGHTYQAQDTKPHGAAPALGSGSLAQV